MRMEIKPVRTVATPDWALSDEEILKELRSEPGRIRLALTGGLASGKSTVAELFRVFGAEIIDFDLLAREAVEPGTGGLAEAVRLLPAKCFNPDGRLNRPLVSRLVFKKPELRAALEAIIHPAAWTLFGRELQRVAAAPLVVIVVPLLFEAGLSTLFAPVGLVFVPPEEQLRRLLVRESGLKKSLARRQIKSQWPLAEKLTRCQYVIDNGRSLARAIHQTKAVWDLLTAKAAPCPPDSDKFGFAGE